MSNLFHPILLPSWSSPAVLPTSALLLLVVLYPLVFGTRRKDSDVYELGGLSILTTWSFFNRRSDFLTSSFAKTGQKLLSFKVLHHSVVAMEGEEARKTFFETRSLDFDEGYKILSGGAPRLSDLDRHTFSVKDESWFNKHLAALLHRERVAEVLPSLFDDIQSRMELWGREGTFDPFTNINDLVWQMTVRMATCREFATNFDAIDKLQKDYWMLKNSATPTALLLPWFPSIATRNKKIATKNLYKTLHECVEKRTTSTPSSDAIDVLLARGLSTDDTVRFILSAIFAGVVNTGVSSCWTLLFLSLHKEWKQKVLNEIRTIIDQHANTVSSDQLHKRLAIIPVSVWEEEMPTLDLVLRETLRLTMNGTMLRRNLIEEISVANKKIRQGAFVAYPVSDAHLNPAIYTDPTQFDPTRFMLGREEDKKQSHAYVGWGSGKEVI
ncbi:cytochrome P450 [Tricholoma matsutake]|nr:cytochrome P450 [Tricholoma matsutake 945]